jgi:PhnB protein
MFIEPYLYFDGRCEEALAFYRTALGAEVQMLMRYSESPEPPPGLKAGMENKIMHSSFRIGDSTVMASDGQCNNAPAFNGFALCVTAPDVAGAEKYFNALADGGKVTMPLTKTFFADSFGMLTDRFGVAWMVFAEAK